MRQLASNTPTPPEPGTSTWDVLTTWTWHGPDYMVAGIAGVVVVGALVGLSLLVAAQYRIVELPSSRRRRELRRAPALSAEQAMVLHFGRTEAIAAPQRAREVAGSRA